MQSTIYNSRSPRCKQPFGALKTGKSADFTIFLPKTTGPAFPEMLLYRMDEWDAPISVPMQPDGMDAQYNRFRCSFSSAAPALYWYYFRYQSDGAWVDVKRSSEGNAGGDGLWQLTIYSTDTEIPTVPGNGIYYQIFPDRFFTSGKPKKNVPEDRILRDDPDGLPEWRPDAEGKVRNNDYFGGDLAGITEKLEYLQSLGVTAVYLNPIFEAHSNHRYNTADYRKIDPLLGEEADFHNLCEQARQCGISIVLDGVFSHTGSDSIYFNREKRYGSGGAYNDPSSPYFCWYRFRQYPDDYDAWWGFPTLPNVEESEPSWLEFICGEGGVAQHWMKLGASGFRLDVADELPDVFLDRFYRAVKDHNPNAAVIGEVWEDASNKISYGQRRRYLLGGQMDSVMNYPFRDALLNYIRYGGGEALLETVLQILEHYPPEAVAVLMNSLSTHDTPRAITMLGGEPQENHDREWQETHHRLSEEQYIHGRRLFLLASIVQFGLPGMPCIYYGDEAGLCGYRDPFNRTCYPWGREDRMILESIRRLGQIRVRYPIFHAASFLPVTFDDAVCSFVRSSGETSILFAVNRSAGPQGLLLPNGEKPEELFGFGSYRNGELDAYSGIVLLWENNRS